jgi:putative transposase
MQEGTIILEKVVRMLMEDAKLVARRKLKWIYTSYMGEITPAPDNLIKRDFHASAPNKKWFTDITEFHIPA